MMSTVDLIIPIAPIDPMTFGQVHYIGVPKRKRDRVAAFAPFDGAYGATAFKMKLVDGGNALRVVASLFKVAYGQNAIVSNAFPKHVRRGLMPQILRSIAKTLPDAHVEWDPTRPVLVNEAHPVRHYQCDSDEQLTNALATMSAEGLNAGVFVTNKGEGPWPTVMLSAMGYDMQMRVYAKHQELMARGHRIPSCVATATEILEEVRYHLRLEAILRKRALEHFGLRVLDDWTKAKITRVFDFCFDRLFLEAPLHTESDLRLSLPKGVLQTYERWRAGARVRDGMATTTYFNHKRALKDVGINIDALPLQRRTTKTRLRDVLNEARRVRIGKRHEHFWKAPEAVLPADLPRDDHVRA